MREFVVTRGVGPRAWLVPFVPGMVLLALGVAILVWPKLLVAMVSAVFLLIGAGLAGLGWRLKQGGGFPPPGFPPGGGFGT